MARPFRIALRSLAAVVLTAAPTVATHVVLDASGPLAVVVAWGVLFALALTFSREAVWRAKTLRWTSLVLAALGALVLVADVVIIPLSAYLLWFELVAAGDARGAVSFVYVMLVGYGSALFAARVTYRPLLVCAAYVAWLSFLAIPILSRPEPVWILAAAALTVVVAGAMRGYRGLARFRAATHATVLVGLALAAAVGLGRVTAPEGSDFVNNVLSPGFRDAIVTVAPNFPIVYDVPGYGYRFSSTDLSRTPVLSNRALFRVAPVTGGSIYLRTEVFDHFTGSGWRVSPGIAAESDAETVRVAESPGGPVELSPDSEIDGIFPPAAPAPRRTVVTVLADFYSALPHTLDTIAVAVSGRDELVFQQSGAALGYVLSDPLLYDDRVTLYRGPRRGGDDTVAPYVGRELGSRDAYLQVPDGIPPELQSLAAGLIGDTDSETIVNTLRFLRDGFEYTLEPPSPADSRQFLEAFIQDHRRGFCVHFATAFVALSRMQGIPARYVTGFLVQPPDRDEFGAGAGPGFTDEVLVSGYSAHAWAELYVPGFGWRIVEATPPMQPAGYEGTFFDRFESIRNEGRTFSQLSEILREDLSASDRRRGLTIRLPELPVWLWALPLAMLLGLGVVLVSRSSDTEYRFRATLRRILRQSAKRDVPSPEVSGWTGWSAGAGHHAGRVASLAAAIFFGGRRVTRRDVRFLRRYRAYSLRFSRTRRSASSNAAIRRGSENIASPPKT